MDDRPSGHHNGHETRIYTLENANGYEPCELLAFAVLERALRDWISVRSNKPLDAIYGYGYRQSERVAPRYREELREFFYNDEVDQPWTLRWIAEHISENPERLINQIRKFVESKGMDNPLKNFIL